MAKKPTKPKPKTAAKSKKAAVSGSPKKAKKKADPGEIPPPMPIKDIEPETLPEPPPKRPVSAHVKHAADRAEARARGESPDYAGGPLTVATVMPSGTGAPPPPMEPEDEELTPKERFKRARGRPTVRTDELVQELLFRVMCGESVRQICADPEMPNRSTIYDWLAADETFSDQYARAHEVAADEAFEEIVEIARMTPPDKGFVAQSKLLIESIQWTVARKVPKKYGDKVDLNINGQISRPIEDSDTPEEAAQKYAESRNID